MSFLVLIREDIVVNYNKAVHSERSGLRMVQYRYVSGSYYKLSKTKVV